MKKTLLNFIFISSHFMAFSQISGTLDSTFGINGRVVSNRYTNLNDIASSIAIQSDGKILVAGSSVTSNVQDTTSMLLVRLKTDGTIDNAFGVNGKVSTKLGISGSVIGAITLQPDGKIVTVGTANSDFGIVRYLSNGALDASFGSNGKVITNLGTNLSSGINLVTLQPDGKIIVAGIYTDYTQSNPIKRIALARYTANGALDVSFNSTGILKLDVNIIGVHSILLQGNSKIVVCGAVATTSFSSTDMVLIQFNANGTLDTSFGINGSLIVQNIFALSAKLSNGKIVVAGADKTTSREAFKVYRFNENGTLDTDFGTNGSTTTQIGTNARAKDVIIQKDGNIFLMGSSDYGTPNSNIALARYNSNGILDNSFGINGKATIPVVQNNEEYLKAAIQADGKIVTCGIIINGGVPTFAVARFNNKLSSETSIAKVSDTQIRIYPNPTARFLNIDMTKNVAEGEIRLKIADMSGRIVYQNKYDKSLIDNTLQINISDLMTGLYVLSMTSDKEQMSQLFSKN
jgi:uncharacterized delta-60 repeat protein